MLLLRSLLIRSLDWLLARGLLRLKINRGARLPCSGPTIVVANHNSHLDILILATLFRWRELRLLRPVAATDYFCRHPVLRYITVNFLRILPIDRRHLCHSKGHPLQECTAALNCGEVLLFFPEGTRGRPGKLSELKPGIAHLARRHPNVPIVPVLLRGLDYVLPKGRIIPRPAPCSARVGDPIYWCGSKRQFMRRLRNSLMDVQVTASLAVVVGPNHRNRFQASTTALIR